MPGRGSRTRHTPRERDSARDDTAACASPVAARDLGHQPRGDAGVRRPARLPDRTQKPRKPRRDRGLRKYRHGDSNRGGRDSIRPYFARPSGIRAAGLRWIPLRSGRHFHPTFTRASRAWDATAGGVAGAGRSACAARRQLPLFLQLDKRAALRVSRGRPPVASRSRSLDARARSSSRLSRKAADERERWQAGGLR